MLKEITNISSSSTTCLKARGPSPRAGTPATAPRPERSRPNSKYTVGYISNGSADWHGYPEWEEPPVPGPPASSISSWAAGKPRADQELEGAADEGDMDLQLLVPTLQWYLQRVGEHGGATFLRRFLAHTVDALIQLDIKWLDTVADFTDVNFTLEEMKQKLDSHEQRDSGLQRQLEEAVASLQKQVSDLSAALHSVAQAQAAVPNAPAACSASERGAMGNAGEPQPSPVMQGASPSLGAQGTSKVKAERGKEALRTAGPCSTSSGPGSGLLLEADKLLLRGVSGTTLRQLKAGDFSSLDALAATSTSGVVTAQYDRCWQSQQEGSWNVVLRVTEEQRAHLLGAAHGLRRGGITVAPYLTELGRELRMRCWGVFAELQQQGLKPRWWGGAEVSYVKGGHRCLHAFS